MQLVGATGLVSLASSSVAGDEHDNETDNHDDAVAEDSDENDHSFNQADIQFLQLMIPHHEQAIEMAELVPFRTDRQELIEISEEIIEFQEAEILQISEWLVEAGENPYAHLRMGHEQMIGEIEDMHSSEEIEDVHNPEEMEQLRSLEGKSFDLEFASLMIDHHRGAIGMAEEVLEVGEDAKVTQLAEEIIEAQEAEITQLRQWCQEWQS